MARPPALSEEQQQVLKELYLQLNKLGDPAYTSRQIQDELKRQGITVSRSTIQRAARDNGWLAEREQRQVDHANVIEGLVDKAGGDLRVALEAKLKDLPGKLEALEIDALTQQMEMRSELTVAAFKSAKAKFLMEGQTFSEIQAIRKKDSKKGMANRAVKDRKWALIPLSQISQFVAALAKVDDKLRERLRAKLYQAMGIEEVEEHTVVISWENTTGFRPPPLAEPKMEVLPEDLEDADGPDADGPV